MAELSLGQHAATDPAQQRVIAAPASARLVVTAGPGTGKTRTLLARASRLVDEEELEPALDLLLLSFSRAAVETVAGRGFEETDLGRLSVSTVDSIASRILFETGTGTAGLDFDARIARAIEVLAEDPPGLAGFLSARHVLVDEAQDVVGVRAKLVLALLRYLCADERGGFTVFGDAAQAIFDFQAGGGEPTTRLLDLLDETSLGAERCELTTNHRMRNARLADLAAKFGSPLRASERDEPWAELRDEIAFEIQLESGWLRPAEAATEVRAVVDSPARPTVAVLTRTNVEALRLASQLQAGGLEVVLRHRAQDRGGAPWLAVLFGAEEFAQVPLREAVERDDLRPWFRPPAEVGRLLREAGVVRDARLDLRRLAALLRTGGCPEALVAQRQAGVTVSNIHQAKGLEFDTVFVTEREPRTEQQDSPEEARVLYVAATRARDELLSGGALQSQGPQVLIAGDSRVAVGSWGGRRHGPVQYVEVKVCDSDPEWAPSDRDEFDRVQARLLGGVCPGDRVELRRVEGGGGQAPVYEIVHCNPEGGEAIVGRTAAAFGEMLRRQTRGRPPEAIRGLMSEMPDAAVLGSAAARRLGLGEHGIHLRARVYGLAWVASG